MAFESFELEEEQLLDPPYRDSAKGITKELSLRLHDLTAADLTQTFWALANLGIDDDSLLQPFLGVLKENNFAAVHSMNTIEATNILWSMGKLRLSDNVDLTLVLAKKLTRKSVHLSPKQAASALYALGRLNFGDKELFDDLSTGIIEQLDTTSAHAVANVLWAYRSVGLRPPQQLLNSWATEKLGLVTVQNINL